MSARLVPSGKAITENDAKGVPVTREPMALDHPCFKEGCFKSAPFGFGVNLRRGQYGRWACADHLDELAELELTGTGRMPR